MNRTWRSTLKIAVLGLCAGFLATPVLAQQKPSPAAIALAGEVIKAKGGDRIFSAIVPGVIEQNKNQILQQNPMLQSPLNEVAANMRKEFTPKASELLNEAATAYASHFTEAELKEVLAFYQSPVGRKTIAEEPKVLEQSMASAQEWALSFSDLVQKQFRSEMKKKGHDL